MKKKEIGVLFYTTSQGKDTHIHTHTHTHTEGRNRFKLHAHVRR